MKTAIHIGKFFKPYLPVAIFFCLFAAIFCGCKDKSKHARKSGPKNNIIILSVESLRWDHLGCYGYSRPISPNIDKLAASGTLFHRAYAQSSWTKPSIASTFTSTFFSTHEVHNIQGQEGTDNLEKLFPVLREKFSTLPSFFALQSYRNFGMTYNRHLWDKFGFGRGFAEYSSQISDETALERIMSLIKNENEPWLIFWHIMAPHWEYNPPPEYRMYDQNPEAITISGQNWREICDGKIKLSSEDLAHNIALYDGAIAYADNMIGKIVDAIDAKGIRDRAWIVVTSDHGEEFLEHGGVGHGRSLYEEVIRAPMIISGPNVPAARRIETPAQNIDLFPTLADLGDFEVPKGLQGLSLTPLFEEKGVNSWPRKFVFSEVEVDLHTVIGAKFKYIVNHQNGHEELYDLIEDPLEKNNLASIPAYNKVKILFADESKRLLSQNKSISNDNGKIETIGAPEEMLEKLKSLGYIR